MRSKMALAAVLRRWHGVAASAKMAGRAAQQAAAVAVRQLWRSAIWWRAGINACNLRGAAHHLHSAYRGGMAYKAASAA